MKKIGKSNGFTFKRWGHNIVYNSKIKNIRWREKGYKKIKKKRSYIFRENDITIYIMNILLEKIKFLFFFFLISIYYNILNIDINNISINLEIFLEKWNKGISI